MIKLASHNCATPKELMNMGNNIQNRTTTPPKNIIICLLVKADSTICNPAQMLR